MCGICGIVDHSGSIPSPELLRTMARTLRHRGPDDEGYFTDGEVGFGFQRLAIIDQAGGHQPMSTEDGSLSLVFNGEIYNYQRLREELEATGRHHFRTNSDTEIILHLYQEEGEHCVQRLRGMFAFAIWDRKEKKLMLARDRLGKKPLVYAHLPGVFLFGSELKALLKHPAVKKDIHYPAIDLYLTYQYIPSPDTIFKQIKKLPSAHFLILKDKQLRLQRYWEPPFEPKTALSFKDAQTQMMTKLKEATQLRMIADVPLGAFLSGGKDSSIIVGLMSQLSSKPIQTFSIGFEEDRFSELPYAREVANHFKCDHHEFVVKAETIDILPKLAWHYGEPFADSSALPSYYVSQITRRSVTVALNGDGGDETMAGYPRYQAMKFMRLWSRLPHSLRQGLFQIARKVPDGPPPHSLIWRIKRLLSLGLADPGRAYLDTMCFFREEEKQPLYSDWMREQVATSQAPTYLANLVAKAQNLSGIDPYLYADLNSYLPECLMVKMDIASMANSLEARSPFLDHEFVELVGSFPSSWKLSGMTHTKHILTDAVKGWIPQSILRRKKQGFALPMSHWFRTALRGYVRETLLSREALSRGIFRKEGIEAILTANESGQKDHSYQLWALLMLEHWYRAYMDA